MYVCMYVWGVLQAKHLGTWGALTCRVGGGPSNRPLWSRGWHKVRQSAPTVWLRRPRDLGTWGALACREGRVTGRCRAMGEQLSRVYGLLPESRGQILAVTVSYVAYWLDRGWARVGMGNPVLRSVPTTGVPRS